MIEILVGVVTLGSLVALQAGLRHRTQGKLVRAWERAQKDLAQDDLGAAETQLAECARLVPLWLPARYLLGAVLAKQGKLDRAEEQFKMAQALQPREASGFIELGIFYVTMANRTDDGLAQFREALRLDPAARPQHEGDPRLASFRESAAFAALEQV